MLYFLKKKIGKIAVALGAPPPNPRWPPAVRGSAPRPSSCYFLSIYGLFLVLRRFLDIVKIKIMTYYLILEWRLMDPLAKLAPPAQTSSYATTNNNLQHNHVIMIKQKSRKNLWYLRTILLKNRKFWKVALAALPLLIGLKNFLQKGSFVFF